MENELIALFETVKKAADVAENSSGEEDRCVDSLEQLKKFPVNYQLLVSTQIGKHLRQLTKHKCEKIKALASVVVEMWKSIILKETSKINKAKNIQSKSKAEEGLKTELSSSIKIEKTKVEVEKSSSKLSSMVYCKDPMRDKVREILAEALCKVYNEINDNDDLKGRANRCDPYRVAVIVETTMFEKWGKSNGAHKHKYRSVIFNIKDPKNPDFRRKLLLGDIEPGKIPQLTPEEMASDERKAEIEELKNRALKNSMGREPLKASTDQFTCGRCKKKETVYEQKQTRSADEPMTTYVTCVNCNNRWKFC